MYKASAAWRMLRRGFHKTNRRSRRSWQSVCANHVAVRVLIQSKRSFLRLGSLLRPHTLFKWTQTLAGPSDLSSTRQEPLVCVSACRRKNDGHGPWCTLVSEAWAWLHRGGDERTRRMIKLSFAVVLWTSWRRSLLLELFEAIYKPEEAGGLAVSVSVERRILFRLR